MVMFRPVCVVNIVFVLVCLESFQISHVDVLLGNPGEINMFKLIKLIAVI